MEEKNTDQNQTLRDQIQQMLAGTLCEVMKMELMEISADSAVMRMPIKGNNQPQGIIHGGASIALAETIVSIAASVHGVNLYGPGAYAVGTHYSASHHRAGKGEFVTAYAKASHLGRTTCSYVVEIKRDDGVVISTVLGSAHIMKP